MKPPPPCVRVEAEVGDLDNLSRSELLEHWRKLYGAAAPKGISRALLIRAIAYAIQAKRYGGRKPAMVRQLRKAAEGSLLGEGRARGAVAKLQPGARLIREWHGSTHIVEVVDGGFVWNGERYRSLSVIARAITGTRWSGPRFFSLSRGSAQ